MTIVFGIIVVLLIVVFGFLFVAGLVAVVQAIKENGWLP